ncbi:MAG: DUF58 domain-containing protein [Candidatus Dormibacteraeota bacterium]|uniref:DUF58 domain-containing protein n=1 Tax=Candidatus Amunia macphersoniae TaxID=3127014 RepID=A0A934NJF2_9BACT|nr:DUF58 domain-containing protein [Candidatus Dormibacteraeota bacterium]
MTGAGAELGIDGGVIALLDRLALSSRRPVLGSPGVRRARRTGGAVEFADHRAYTPGDDIRRVDWNAYARLDRLILRLYAGEEDTTVTLWIDVSSSMGFGRPSKLHAAAALAGALGYVALAGYDRVAVATFSGDVAWPVPPLRGRARVEALWRALLALRASGSTDFAALARAAPRSRPGLCIVISDFLSEPGPARGLTALRQGGSDVTLIQLLAPDEISPALSGDLRLRDAESGATVEVTVTPALLAEYAAALSAHQAALRGVARRHRGDLLTLRSDTPLREALGACRSHTLLR